MCHGQNAGEGKPLSMGRRGHSLAAGVIDAGRQWRAHPRNGKLADYQNYAIGVLHGSYQEKYLQEHGFTHLEAFSSYREGYQMLRAKRITLWAANQLTAYSTVQQMHDQPGQVLQTAFVFKQLPQGMSMAFSLGTPPATVEAFRQALEGIKRDGRYQQILKQNSE
jgi:polar amino acid transport system substrate-binding protein